MLKVVLSLGLLALSGSAYAAAAPCDAVQLSGRFSCKFHGTPSVFEIDQKKDVFSVALVQEGEVQGRLLYVADGVLRREEDGSAGRIEEYRATCSQAGLEVKIYFGRTESNIGLNALLTVAPTRTGMLWTRVYYDEKGKVYATDRASCRKLKK